MTISGYFERFQYFNFERDFLENENLFQKPGVPHFHTKLLAISEANVKTNRMVSMNGPITKSAEFCQ